jgi:hypothetical protein
MQPYPYPEPRSFAQWRSDLGISSQGKPWPDDHLMTYLEFCYLPETTLRKINEGTLYGFWRQYGDIYGEARTVEEWLHDIGWRIVGATEDDLQDLNLFLGYDEFWEWGSGRIEQDVKNPERTGLLEKLKSSATQGPAAP